MRYDTETFHYDVTITNTDLAIYDAGHDEHPSFDDFAQCYQDEMIFARHILKDAPIGAQLHAHFKGKQLEYTDRETGHSKLIAHTYLKIKNDLLCVKLTRKCILAKGAFGRVKLLFNLDNGNRIAAKEFFLPNQKDAEAHLDKTLHVNTFTHEFNGSITDQIVYRLRNPFKREHPIAPQRFGNVFLHFHPNKVIEHTPSSTAYTKPFLYYEYRGEDLVAFMMQKKHFRATDIPNLPLLIQKLLHALNKIHRAGFLHCDIKPENTLILRDEPTDELHPYFCDFDFSEKMSPISFSTHAELRGTPYYLAPELLIYLNQHHQIFTKYPELVPIRNTLADYLQLPNGRKNFENGSCHLVTYTTKTDIYALGRTITAVLTKDPIIALLQTATPENQKKIRDISQLIRLMRHSIANARPDLMLMQLAILPYQDLTPETLPHLLQTFQLPAISIDNLHCLSKSLSLIAAYFSIHNPHSHDLVSWLYKYITEQFINETPQPVEAVQLVEFICLLHTKKVALSADLIKGHFFGTKYVFINLQKQLDLFTFDSNTAIFSNQYCFVLFFEIMQHVNVASQHTHQTALLQTCSNHIITIAQQAICKKPGALELRSALNDIELYANILQSLLNGNNIWDIIVAAAHQKNELKLKFLEKSGIQSHFGAIPEKNVKEIIHLGATLDSSISMRSLIRLAFFTRQFSSSGFFATPQSFIAGNLRFKHNFMVVTVINCILQITAQKPHSCETLQDDTKKLQLFLEEIRNNRLDVATQLIELPTTLKDPIMSDILKHLLWTCENQTFLSDQCFHIIYCYESALDRKLSLHQHQPDMPLA